MEERVNYQKFWVICSLHSLALAHIGTLFVRFIAQLDPFMLAIITFGWSDDSGGGGSQYRWEGGVWHGKVGRCKDIYPVEETLDLYSTKLRITPKRNTSTLDPYSGFESSAFKPQGVCRRYAWLFHTWLLYKSQSSRLHYPALELNWIWIQPPWLVALVSYYQLSCPTAASGKIDVFTGHECIFPWCKWAHCGGPVGEPDDNHRPMVVLGWVIYWLNGAAIASGSTCQHHGLHSELHITAAHSSSFGKSGPFFLGRVCGFLGAWTLLSFGKSANDCRGHKSRTTQAYLQWCSCYEILWIYFHCTSYNKSSKALDEGLRFAQSHQSSVTYVPQEFMVRSCPASGKNYHPLKINGLKMKSLSKLVPFLRRCQFSGG